MSEADAVNVFSYLDYREALRALYAPKKAHEYGFSHRAFSRRAGLKSTNFLKLVMDGERNLSPDAAQRLARALNLHAAEADYHADPYGRCLRTCASDTDCDTFSTCSENVCNLKTSAVRTVS